MWASSIDKMYNEKQIEMQNSRDDDFKSSGCKNRLVDLTRERARRISRYHLA